MAVHYTRIRMRAGSEWFWQDTSAIGAPQRPHSPRAMARRSVPLSCLSLVARASMHALQRTWVSRQARRVGTLACLETCRGPIDTALLLILPFSYRPPHITQTPWRTVSTQISTQEAAGETEQQLAASLRALGAHPLIMSSALISRPSSPLAGPTVPRTSTI
jgi:hypothetical protein